MYKLQKSKISILVGLALLAISLPVVPDTGKTVFQPISQLQAGVQDLSLLEGFDDFLGSFVDGVAEDGSVVRYVDDEVFYALNLKNDSYGGYDCNKECILWDFELENLFIYRCASNHEYCPKPIPTYKKCIKWEINCKDKFPIIHPNDPHDPRPNLPDIKN